MKRLARMFMMTCVAALALAGVATGASAATTYTISATGEVTSTSTSTHTITIGSSNVVKCTSAHGSGTITSVKAISQHMTVTYSGCSANFFGFPAGTVHVSPATYNFTVNGEVHVMSPISIKSTGLGCETIISKQTWRTVSYANSSPISTLTVTANVGGIVSTSPNGCPTGTTGTYTGSSVWERVGGGAISVD